MKLDCRPACLAAAVAGVSAEGEGVAGGAQGRNDFLAVLGASGLYLQDDFGLVHVQPGSQPLVGDVEYVGAQVGQVGQQLGQRPRTIGQAAAEGQVAAGRGAGAAEGLGPDAAG